MVKDYLDKTPRPSQEGIRLSFAVPALVVTLGVLFICLTTVGCENGVLPPSAPSKSTARLFREWPAERKPDMVVLLSSEQHGFLKECGCSKPQLGGVDRRYNFLRKLVKERGWPVVSVDLGDIAQRSGPQTLLKYYYSMKALNLLGYTAVGVGENEMRLPLFEALGIYALNSPSPRVLAANLLNKEQNFANMVASWKIAGGKDGALKVGVAGAVGPQVSQAVRDPDVRFASNEKILTSALKEMEAEQPELLVLLYQGSVDEAKACAARFPQFHIILCLSHEEEPSGQPEKAGNTLVVSVGHKGRYVGLVGAYRTGKAEQPFDLHYQLVPMIEDYMTPEGQEADNPVLALLEEYAKEVKQGNYLAHYAAKKTEHPIQMEAQFKDATYVGSEKCKRCHEYAYNVWKASPHSHAYHSLETAKRPSLRQFDGECLSCHVTGFDFKGGFTDATTTPHLLDNGCENCHGPASIHVKGGNRGLDPKLLALMNPYKTPPNETAEQKNLRVNRRLDQSCQKCHDIDNDVHWTIDKWTKGHIIHNEPKE